MRHVPILALVLLAACREESVSADPAGLWELTDLAGEAVPAGITLDLTEPGQIAGEAPCNRYTGPLDADYPEFVAGNLAVTRRACPELEIETRYFELLRAMTQAETAGDTLTLSNEAGDRLVYSRAAP